MGKHATRRGYFWSSLGGAILGALLVGVLLVSMLPATASIGDRLVLGASNRSGRSTWLTSKGPSVLKLNNSAGNPVLDLRNGGTAAPLVVDSDRRVPGFNADKVDGRHARDLIRVAYDSTSNAPNANGAAATVTIEAPQSGLLVMSGTIDALGDDYDKYQCQLKVDGTLVLGTPMVSIVHDAGGAATVNNSENCSTTGVYPVAAGSYDITLDIDGRDTVVFGNASLWAMYVPFDGTGATP